MKYLRYGHARPGSLLPVVLALLAAALLMAGSSCTREKKPSMILVIFDTFPAGHSSAYGYERSTSATLERLAADGIRYEHAVAASPWTLPSIASLLTGTLPLRHQAGWHLDPYTMDDRRLAPLDPAIVTLAELFQGRGYQTVGFFNNPFVHPEYGLNKGFDLYDYNGGDNLTIRTAPDVVNGAINWIEMNGGKPFFMVLHFFDPHLAYNPPIEFALPYTMNYQGSLRIPFNPELKDIRSGAVTFTDEDKSFITGLFDAEIAATDFQLGRFITYLKDKGLYDGSLIVATADHGEELWEHGGFEHGHSLHREVLETPLVFKYPGRENAGAVVSEYVSLMDVFPTVAEFFGWPAPLDLDGVSLLPRAGSVKVQPHPIVAMNLHYGPEQQCFYDQGVKLIINVETGKISIYDLSHDLGETKDVFGEIEPPESIKNQIKKIAADLDQLRRDESAIKPAQLDEETIRKLESLGYFTKSASPAAGDTADQPPP